MAHEQCFSQFGYRELLERPVVLQEEQEKEERSKVEVADGDRASRDRRRYETQTRHPRRGVVKSVSRGRLGRKSVTAEFASGVEARSSMLWLTAHERRDERLDYRDKVRV